MCLTWVEMMLTSTSSLPERLLDPERIRLARLRRGLTMTELADRVHLTPRRIRSYEKDGAPRTAAPALAEALRFPVGYFDRRNTPEVHGPTVAFRAGRGTTKRQRDAAVAAGATGVEVNGWISDRFQLPAIRVPDLACEEPRLAAMMLREEWGLGTAPLPNLVQLCESRGVRVYGLPELAESVDAYSFWRGATPFIFTARRKTPERTRFDLAHELGHLVLHRHSDEESTPAQEREADGFASELLIPRTSITEYLPYNPEVVQVLKVKRSFQISAMALAYATHKAGRMSDWVYRQTCITLSQRGYRSGEPDGMEHHERSRVFPAVLSADRQERMTVSRIAEDLSLPAGDIHALTMGTELRVVTADEPASSTSRPRGPSGRHGRPHLHAI